MDDIIAERTRGLIDDLKTVCRDFGMGNDTGEYKVITQAFQYKFLHDKFIKEMTAGLSIAEGTSKYNALMAMDDAEYEQQMKYLPAGVAKFHKTQLIPTLHNRQNVAGFDALFDQTLNDIAAQNSKIFAVRTSSEETVQMFDEHLSHLVVNTAERAGFCRALISKLSQFSFDDIVDRGYDFFSGIYEYLIKDYNSDSGGKYAEYFTPHSVGRVMAEILVDGEPKSVTCYDPSAGSGTLLMCLADRIGSKRCTIYSQDISQKSSGLLRLNLVLNNLAKSLKTVVQGNTLTAPAFSAPTGGLMQFDYIVSNPPFNLDFSGFRDDLDIPERKPIYFAGVPTIPASKKSSMSIYLCFIQHVVASLKPKGKAAIVVPSGFLTLTPKSDKVAYAIREKLVKNKWIRGVVSMPSNIFGKTGTNVSVLFIDKEGADTRKGAILIDASKLGEDKQVEGKKRHVLSDADEQLIIDAFKKHETVEGLAEVPDYEAMEEKWYSFSYGMYSDVKIEYEPITEADFQQRMTDFSAKFAAMMAKGARLDAEIQTQMNKLRHE